MTSYWKHEGERPLFAKARARIHMLKWGAVCLLGGVLIACSEEPRPATSPPTHEIGKRMKPLEPVDALATFELEAGFQIELVAAEPDVTDPVALAFDENGLLYVAEYFEYPEPHELSAPYGTIRLLEDDTNRATSLGGCGGRAESLLGRAEFL